jgi:ribosomal protein L3
MTFSIQKVENFPEISRSGRVSEELQMIIEALNESVKTGDKFCITGVTKGKAYNFL